MNFVTLITFITTKVLLLDGIYWIDEIHQIDDNQIDAINQIYKTHHIDDIHQMNENQIEKIYNRNEML